MRYLINNKVVDEQAFDLSLEDAISKEIDYERVADYIDETYGTIEIGDKTFYASDILYKMDRQQFIIERETYIQDQLNVVRTELWYSDSVVVAGIEFRIEED